MSKHTNPADKVERWDINRLVPYAKNSRTHSDAQVAQIAASIREWGWTTPILVDDDGGIIAGHGRLQAARLLKMTEVPVVVASGWSDAQKRAYVIADNKIALNAEWDDELLKIELAELDSLEFDLSLLGWGDELPEFAEAPDYTVLDGEDLEKQLNEMAAGVKKAIQIEFEPEHYEEAQNLVKFWRSQGGYVGMMLINKLRAEKAKL